MITDEEWAIVKREHDVIPEVVRRELEYPQWEKAGQVHDWRNYVPEFVRERWHRLDALARLCVFLIAESEASREEWD